MKKILEPVTKLVVAGAPVQKPGIAEAVSEELPGVFDAVYAKINSADAEKIRRIQKTFEHLRGFGDESYRALFAAVSMWVAGNEV